MAKNKTLSIKIDEDLKSIFEDICEKLHTTPSHELRLLIHQFVKVHQNKK